MEQNSGGGSFWSSLPGCLTGIAAVITAVGGVIVILDQMEGRNETPAPHREEPAPSDQDSVTPPEPAGFRIIELGARASERTYRGPCPVTLRFRGRISVAGGAGTVSYKWQRSDGASAPLETIDFSRPGTEDIESTWRIGGPGMRYEGWKQIETFDPASQTSNRASFSIQCDG